MPKHLRAGRRTGLRDCRYSRGLSWHPRHVPLRSPGPKRGVMAGIWGRIRGERRGRDGGAKEAERATNGREKAKKEWP